MDRLVVRDAIAEEPHVDEALMNDTPRAPIVRKCTVKCRTPQPRFILGNTTGAEQAHPESERQRSDHVARCAPGASARLIYRGGDHVRCFGGERDGRIHQSLATEMERQPPVKSISQRDLEVGQGLVERCRDVQVPLVQPHSTLAAAAWQRHKGRADRLTSTRTTHRFPTRRLPALSWLRMPRDSPSACKRPGALPCAAGSAALTSTRSYLTTATLIFVRPGTRLCLQATRGTRFAPADGSQAYRLSAPAW